NRKCCISDEDCVLGGRGCIIKECYNKDHWTDYYNFHMECGEMIKDPVYPYIDCECVNNYCVEIEEG
ncbi:MAG TPA: hypothetical protein VMZ91_07240, partial [Candidatus Paceibacterota bacterium]|nr:hypothetical protein [Candidatus Paceibacterota bacterium]